MSTTPDDALALGCAAFARDESKTAVAAAIGVVPCTLSVYLARGRAGDPRYVALLEAERAASERARAVKLASLEAARTGKAAPVALVRDRDTRQPVAADAVMAAILAGATAAAAALGRSSPRFAASATWGSLRAQFHGLPEVERRAAIVRLLAEEAQRIRDDAGASLNPCGVVTAGAA